MCKIKTLSGCGLREEFTAFEIEALKYAVDNNLTAGANFPFKTEESGFNVLQNDDTTISLQRVSNNKTLTAAKVAEGEKVSRPQKAAAPVAPAESPAVGGGDAVTNAVNALLAAVEAQKAAAAVPAVDAAEVARLVAAEVAKVRAEIEKAHTTKVVVNDVHISPLDGEILHPLFNDVCDSIANNDIPFLVGPAGTGKNVLAEQVAKAFNLPFYSVGGLQNKYELEGFRDATGAYQSTALYQAMTNGGVFLLDEIDSTAAEVLVPFNSIMANGYYTFPTGERITANKDFHIICAGNTAGRGADEAYCGRFQLDASTLDRFGFFRMSYDERIELAAANNDKELVTFMHDIRRAVATQRLSYTVTPRAMKRIAKMVLRGWSEAKCLMYGLCGGWSDDDIKMLQNNLTCSNKWGEAFKNIAL